MKKLFLIFILILLNVISYQYLIKINQEYDIFNPIYDNALIIQKKDIVLNDESDFMLDDFFEILSFSKYATNTRFENNNLIVTIFSNSESNEYIYDYKIIKPEPIINTITEYIYVNTKEENTVNPVEIQYQNEDPYLDVYQYSYSYTKGISLSYIIEDISNNFDSNVDVTIEYSSLNPNIEGDYNVKLLSSIKNVSLTINIY